MNPWKLPAIFAATAIAVIMGLQAYASSAALDHRDRLFMEAATRAGLFELRSADLALQRASDAELRAYVQAARRDQAEARTRLLAIAAAKSRSVPGAVDGEQHTMLGELQKAAPGDFDRLYLQKVAVYAQQSVVWLFEEAAQESKDPELRAYAASMLPVLQLRLEQARALQAAQWAAGPDSGPDLPAGV
ncbi:DUF4142 domain-containing protein [Bordetella petrii]|uniref:DUF4142 domain-containing protein n=1 Tax=Bordetella petrii TaxID=94624 RepID=UPI001E28B43A|nr:DUF4142 domain-containing protein [Bordetella petrii]MCD0505183.1 DUF4142 domain-containing protein [Bordetella petrii]